MGVVAVVERGMRPVMVATACKVVWKLAKSVGEHPLRPCGSWNVIATVEST